MVCAFSSASLLSWHWLVGRKHQQIKLNSSGWAEVLRASNNKEHGFLKNLIYLKERGAVE
eukprot:1199584-Amphidinium_carterae.1